MLKKSLTAWQDWGLSAKPSLIRVFTEGKNHQTGLIESAGKKYVLKLFNHSIDTAIATQQRAAQHQIAPKVLYQNQKLALMEYITGGLPSLNNTAKALYSLHQNVDAGNTSASLNLIQSCDKYLTDAPETLRVKHVLLLPILKEFIDDPTPHCLCHNDLVNENCLSKNGRAVFIDWEYAAIGNPWFDLAAIVLYRNLGLSQAAEFLEAYQDQYGKTSHRIFLTSQIALLWCDLLWHTQKYGSHYQEKHSTRFEHLEQLRRTLNKH